MLKPVLPVRSLVSVPSRVGKISVKGTSIKTTKNIENEKDHLALRALEELFTFIEHVRALTLCSMSKKMGLHEWLDNLIAVLLDIHQILISGYDRGSWSSLESLEIQSLHATLDAAWTVEDDRSGLIDCDNEVTELLINLVEFWLNEIKTRGYVLEGILNESESNDIVTYSLDYMSRVNYPPLYGDS
jgi:hypothetical protein